MTWRMPVTLSAGSMSARRGPVAPFLTPVSIECDNTLSTDIWNIATWI